MSRRVAWEDLTNADTAPVPAWVFKASSALEIDEFLRSRFTGRSPTIRPDLRRAAVSYGRRALEIAIVAADLESGQSPPRCEWEGHWERTRDMGKAGADGLRSALRALDPRPGMSVRAYAKPLFQTRLGEGETQLGEGARRLSTRKRARHDAYVLLQARHILTRLAADAERRRKEFTGAITNVDDQATIERRAFVRMLSEAWVFIMGRAPGNSPAPNPFLDFAGAAWRDWRGTPAAPNFYRALCAALDALPESRIVVLAAQGPDWLDVANPYPQFLTPL
jgi:hypothetical protein